MAENVNTAETNNEVATPPEANAVPGNTADTSSSVNNEGFTEGTDANGEGGNNTPGEANTTGDKKRNAEYARRRREAEATEKIRIAEINAIKKVLPNNPYTHQPIETNEDVEEYLIMKGIEDAGGDPVNDYFAKIRETRATKQKNADKNALLQRRIDEFEEKYPDVDFKSLLKDADFREYAEGKLDDKSFAEVYTAYTEFKNRLSSKAEDTATKRAAQGMANSAAAVGSLNNNIPPQESDFFTRDQVKAMNKEEVRKNYDKIMKSMKKW